MQPQSEYEVGLVVEALRQRLDPKLDIIWNPKARMVKCGHYSELGKNIPPEYEGLFAVILRQNSALHDRDYTVLFHVTEPVRTGRRGILMMQNDGPYAPVGLWLVEYLQQFDAAQRAFASSMEEVWHEHDKAEDLTAHIHDRAAHQEALEKVYCEQGGGEYWMGRGFGKGPRSADRTTKTTTTT